MVYANPKLKLKIFFTSKLDATIQLIYLNPNLINSIKFKKHFDYYDDDDITCWTLLFHNEGEFIVWQYCDMMSLPVIIKNKPYKKIFFDTENDKYNFFKSLYKALFNWSISNNFMNRYSEQRIKYYNDLWIIY